VSSSRIVTSEVAKRYANALIELAESQKILDKIEQDLNALHAMMTSSADLRNTIRSPLIDKSALARSMDAISEKSGFQALTKNFLGVLVKNRRLSALVEII
jgi:F-type H+-transporting ATPase subunit delta